MLPTSYRVARTTAPFPLLCPSGASQHLRDALHIQNLRHRFLLQEARRVLSSGETFGFKLRAQGVDRTRGCAGCSFFRKIGLPASVPSKKARTLRWTLAAAATRSGQSEDGADQEHPNDNAGGLAVDRADAQVPVPVNAHAWRLARKGWQGSC